MLSQVLRDIRGNSAPNSLPREYKQVRELFIEARDKQTPVLVENSEFRAPYSVTMKVEYVGDRWCMGKVRYYNAGVEIYVPYTIHYADVFSSDKVSSAARNMTIIFKGRNPFGTGHREGTAED